MYLKFVLLVFALSLPFWLVGALASSLSSVLPINLPVSSLMAFCPLLAAVIITYRTSKTSGVKHLLRSAFDYRSITGFWVVPIIFLMPATLTVVYWVMRLMNAPLPDTPTPFQLAPVFLIVFFISAVGEEVGWSGYALAPLQNRWGALNAGIILGVVWASWHLVPFMQAHHPPGWIAWQCLVTISGRVIIVWLYNSTGKNVFAAILYHAFSNVSVFLFPNYGSHYDPAITGIALTGTAVVVAFVWGPRTLAHYQFA